MDLVFGNGLSLMEAMRFLYYKHIKLHIDTVKWASALRNGPILWATGLGLQMFFFIK